jgi:hypothetical protein
VLPDRYSVDTIRAILDEFDVGGRLRYIREFIWRGGTLQLHAQPFDVAYALQADWPAPVLEPLASRDTGLVAWRRPVLEGRWIRGSSGYELHVGIDGSMPSSIYIRSHRLLAQVPFAQRSPAQVEEAIRIELTLYVSEFLNTSKPVPQAREEATQRLRSLGLAA